MAGLSPTQRTLKACREQGRIAEVVERYIPYAGPYGQKKDLFNYIDIIAVDPWHGIVGIQSFGQNWPEHVNKLKREPNEGIYEWLKWAEIELWGWRKVKQKRGGKAMRWRPRIADVILNGDNIEVKERKS